MAGALTRGTELAVEFRRRVSGLGGDHSIGILLGSVRKSDSLGPGENQRTLSASARNLG